MNEQLLEKILNNPVIPVFYDDDLQTCIAILKSCYTGGIRVFEFVNRGREAKANFKALLAYKEEHFPDLSLGIGTIMNPDDAERFIDLGTDFLVSPIFNESIAAVARKNNILWIPGCMTPSEIAAANLAGCTYIKLFPGDTLGPGFLKSIRPVFPNIRFMPTGGVECAEDNIKTWFEAGVSSVGLGSKLFSKKDGQYDLDQIEANCRNLLAWATKKGT